MRVTKRGFFSPTKYDAVSQRGGGLVEVLLALVIISLATPFTYSMISDATHTMHNMAIANDIISIRDGMLNFVRINQDFWPDTVQIKMSDDEVSQFSGSISSGFIDKYTVNGGAVIDVYLEFDLDLPTQRVAQIANYIGTDAALIDDAGIAHGDTWAVTAPDFKPGGLVYKITRSMSDFDTSRFLHRGESGEDGLNVMMRDLNMGGYDVYNVGTVEGKSVRVRNLDATFVNTETLDAKSVYFSAGANMNGDNVKIGTLRVSGDINGFRNIDAKKLNGSAFNLNGAVVADRATINNLLNVAGNLVLKSSSLKTISGFSAMSVGSVYTPYIVAREIIFNENFGLTVSGELLVSGNPPIKIGSWSFPSNTPPSFSSLVLTRAKIPTIPDKSEFNAIISNGWRTK